MKGYRTLLLASFPLLWSILAQMGISVPLEEQGQIVAGVTAIMMIVMRKFSDTKLGEQI